MTTLLQLMFRPFLLLSAFITVQVVLGDPQNVTCDDQDGCNVTTGGASLNYIPSTRWIQGSTCKSCPPQPDSSQTYNSTWHDASLEAGENEQVMFNITFHGKCTTSISKVIGLRCFLGTAIYTYFVFPDDVPFFGPGAIVLSNMSVFLDDELVGNVLHVPQNETIYRYAKLGYANTSLSNDTHMLSIAANNEVSSSQIIFDFYMYTYVLLLSRDFPG